MKASEENFENLIRTHIDKHNDQVVTDHFTQNVMSQVYREQLTLSTMKPRTMALILTGCSLAWLAGVVLIFQTVDFSVAWGYLTGLIPFVSSGSVRTILIVGIAYTMIARVVISIPIFLRADSAFKI